MVCNIFRVGVSNSMTRSAVKADGLPTTSLARVLLPQVAGCQVDYAEWP